MRYRVECTPINVLQLFCWHMTPYHHWAIYPMIIYTHPAAGNLPIWLLSNGQQVQCHVCTLLHGM